MNIKTENKLKEEFEKTLRQTHTRGLIEGCKALSKVILDKANNTDKTPEERILDIIKFCEVSLSKDN